MTTADLQDYVADGELTLEQLVACLRTLGHRGVDIGLMCQLVEGVALHKPLNYHGVRWLARETDWEDAIGETVAEWVLENVNDARDRAANTQPDPVRAFPRVT